MDYETFVERTRDRLGARERDEAAAAMQATLATLGEQLSPEQARDLARGLPDGVADELRRHAGGDPDDTPLESFYAKVGRRQSPRAEPDYAREQVHAVLAVLSEGADPDELRAAAAQLSVDYRQLLGAAD